MAHDRHHPKPRPPQKQTPAHKAFALFVDIVGDQAVVARFLGISQPQVSRIASHRSSAGLPSALLIEREAGIPATAWGSGEDVRLERVIRKAKALRARVQQKGRLIMGAAFTAPAFRAARAASCAIHTTSRAI